MKLTPSQQLEFTGFEASDPVFVCPLCGEPATLFGQYSPIHRWCLCRACSLQYPYPVELFVPSTRRNADTNPLMIDPTSLSELRERRIQLDEMVRCAIDPARAERPIIKYNLSGLELYNPIRRSKVHQYQRWHAEAKRRLSHRQMQLPMCQRCGCAHDRTYEMLPGATDYWSHCQRCDDEISVEALFRHRGIFGKDDVESILDRIHASTPELFERGVLPDYWFALLGETR